MTIIRFNPWFELDRIQRQLDHVFEEATPSLNWDGMGNSGAPAVEFHEKENSIHLKIELPGINPDDLNIEVTEDAVSIAGERKSETKSEKKGVIRSEFRYGTFRRVIPLPSRVKNADVTASYQDGILHLTLPKTDVERNRVVKISLNGQAPQSIKGTEAKAEAESAS
ncbi:MAG: Hsp20/alpha crystallin family protein [Elainellaceae cyanobacterium]